jgi:DNA modification methylase
LLKEYGVEFSADATLMCGDGLQLMDQMPSRSVDLIFCDLPYGVTSNPLDVVIPFEELWPAYRRIAKPNAAIVLTAMQPFSSLLVASNPKRFKYEWIWRKNRASGFLNAKKQPLRNHEHVLVFCYGTPPYYPQMTEGHKPVHGFTKRQNHGNNNYGATPNEWSGGGSTQRYPVTIQDFSVVNNDTSLRIHPTQKPTSLIEYMIQTYSQPGALVLDNCAGSFSTAIACLNTDRRFVGMEINEDRFELGARWVQEHANACGKVCIRHPAPV